MTSIGSNVAAGTDHHSGWYYVPAGTVITIAENKQMTVWGDFIVDGDILNEGQLILEA